MLVVSLLLLYFQTLWMMRESETNIIICSLFIWLRSSSSMQTIWLFQWTLPRLATAGSVQIILLSISTPRSAAPRSLCVLARTPNFHGACSKNHPLCKLDKHEMICTRMVAIYNRSWDMEHNSDTYPLQCQQNHIQGYMTKVAVYSRIIQGVLYIADAKISKFINIIH